MVAEALSDTPVVLLLGARQVGKSTLAKVMLESRSEGRYLTLDDPAIRRAAEVDPMGFVTKANGLTVLDEIQLAPQLFRVIKTEVDKDRRPGRFLLTGSANVLVLPKLSESLAGRMELLTLEGLSQSEIVGHSSNLVDRLFAHAPLSLQYLELDREALISAILAGGFPEAKGRAVGRRRSQWFESYLQTLLQRDVRDLSQIEGITQLPRIWELLSVRSAGLLNLSELSRTLGIPLNTLKRYLGLLEALFILTTLPAWSNHLGKRLGPPAWYAHCISCDCLPCGVVGDGAWGQIKKHKNITMFLCFLKPPFQSSSPVRPRPLVAPEFRAGRSTD